MFAVMFMSGVLPISAQNHNDSTSQLNALVASITKTEKLTLKDILARRPLVETTLQTVAEGSRTPNGDRYFLSRVKLGRELHDVLYDDPSTPDAPGHHGLFRAMDRVSSLTVAHVPMSYDPHAFVEMLSPDVRGIKADNYTFSILRQEFLGDIKTTVVNVEPRKKGLFRGRMWVEDEGHIVRFMGVFGGAESSSHPRFVHFDSWRSNVAPSVWLPSAIYIEEPIPGGTLRGQIRIWGYGIDEREQYASTHVSVHVDGATDQQQDGTNVDPLTALHQWQDLASDNVLTKMESAGILAPEGEFETKVLNQIVTNLSIPSDLAFSKPVKCRVLLTTPLEAMTVGNTIVVSRGLIETMPSEEVIASVLAFEIGHILVDGGIDTKYSFGDRTMVQDSSIYKHLPLAHSEADDTQAAQKAIELLKKSMYADKLNNVGLYFRQYEALSGKLKELFRPRMGDSLISSAHSTWLLPALEATTPALNPSSLSQVAALPLGANLVVDPWSGEVALNTTARIIPSLLDEKRPFQVMPVFFWLKTKSTQTAIQTTGGPTSSTR